MYDKQYSIWKIRDELLDKPRNVQFFFNILFILFTMTCDLFVILITWIAVLQKLIVQQSISVCLCITPIPNVSYLLSLNCQCHHDPTYKELRYFRSEFYNKSFLVLFWKIDFCGLYPVIVVTRSQFQATFAQILPISRPLNSRVLNPDPIHLFLSKPWYLLIDFPFLFFFLKLIASVDLIFNF